MSKVLILRPQPGADATAGAARALGLIPVVAPLFTIRPLAWDAPEDMPDALVFTSGHAARHAGPALAQFAALPCYAVGEATGKAAEAAGCLNVVNGPADGRALTAMLEADGIRSALHLHGRDHIALESEHIRICRRAVYAAEAAPGLAPDAVAALAGGARALLHSPRAARLFARYAPDPAMTGIACISAATAAAAGPGWRHVAIAGAPRDPELLALAAKLCQTEREGADE